MSGREILMLSALVAVMAAVPAAPADVVYATTFTGGNVYRIAADGSVTPFASGFADPTGLALDAAGDVFVADGVNGTVSKVTPAGAVSTFASVPDAYGLAFDNAGNLYVSGAGTIHKVTPGGAVSTFVSGLGGSGSIAFDSSGNLFVVSNSGNTIRRIAPDGMVSPFASLVGPIGLTIDSSGNLYSARFVSNQTTEEVVKITPAGVVSPVAALPAGENSVWGMAIGSNATLYYAGIHHINAILPDGTTAPFAGLESPNLLAVQVPEPTITLLFAAVPALLRRRRTH